MRTLSLLALALSFAACDTADPIAQADLSFEGHVVTYTTVEGGAWVLRDADGELYEPINLAREYQQDGLRVHVEAEVLNDYASTLQVGPIVRIVAIERR